jgi:hypothetical protein
MEIWQTFVRGEQLRKQLEDEKSKAKSKMQMFLEAAAQGKLNTTTQDQEDVKIISDIMDSSVNKKKQLPPKSQRSVRTTTVTTPKQRPKSAQ